MSSNPRGRGRGRGVGRPSSSRQLSPPDGLQDANLAQSNVEAQEDNAAPQDPSSSSLRAESSTDTTSAGPSRPRNPAASLLRRNDYTSSTKMKFMPTMVKRKSKPEIQVKEEQIEESLADPFSGRGSGRGRGRGRGRGDDKEPRGRGRGANDFAMTATGAFGFGPAQQERAKRLGTSGSWGGGAGGAGGGGDGGFGGTRTTSTAALVDSDPEDYGDADENGDGPSGRKSQTVDLYDIGTENEMAPLVLPRDEKKWLEEEKLREENDKAMGKLRIVPESSSKAVKMDPYEEEELAAASLAGTPAASNSASVTPAPTRSSLDEAAPIEDAAVLGADDVKIKVKREDISTYFDLPKENASHEQFYIFQFPRLFPQFADSEALRDVKPSADDLAQSIIEAKHKVKSAYHESEAEAWRDYIPGRWQGWGKNPGREGRDVLGATDAQSQPTIGESSAPEGRIGKIKVRQSGRTTLRLGGIEYEILPGAPANFLQEVAILEDRTNEEEEKSKGMYVIGQASKKFIITPELGRLLQLDARERVERAKQLKEEEDIKARKAKEEQYEGKIPGQKAKRPAAKPTPRSKPGAPPSAPSGVKPRAAPARPAKA